MSNQFIPRMVISENQDVLDLIWKKGYGILNILDDQCRAPGTTDKTFANDLYQKLTGKPRFEANFRQVGARQFGVFHYAGRFIYYFKPVCILYSNYVHLTTLLMWEYRIG